MILDFMIDQLILVKLRVMDTLVNTYVPKRIQV